MKRAIFDILLLVFIFILPWWVSVILAFIGIFLFKRFYEFIISLIILYSLYFIKSIDNLLSIIITAFLINFIYFAIQILKSRIILYKNEIPY